MSGMRAYVTGASGFIGSHVVRELRARGIEVRDDWVDLTNTERLRQAIRGCDSVFHLAALYSYDAPAEEHERVNVHGTRIVVDLCRELGVRRLVYTSTCGTCGPVSGRAATEQDGPPAYELEVPYKRTKLEAEQIVMAAALDGVDAVVVNPTTPVGDGDHFPTPTGQMIAGVANGKYRAYVDTGINVVDVRDVARGHILAWERGRRGERYLLGGVDLSLADVFAVVAELAGLQPTEDPCSPCRPTCAGRRRASERRRGAARAAAHVLLVGEGGARARLRARPGLAGATASRGRGAQRR